MRTDKARELWLESLVQYQGFDDVLYVEQALAEGNTEYVEIANELAEMAYDYGWMDAKDRAHEDGVDTSKAEREVYTPPDAYEWAVQALRAVQDRVPLDELVESAREAAGEKWPGIERFSQVLYHELVGNGIDWTDDYPDYPLHARIQRMYRESLWVDLD